MISCISVFQLGNEITVQTLIYVFNNNRNHSKCFQTATKTCRKRSKPFLKEYFNHLPQIMRMYSKPVGCVRMKASIELSVNT